MKAEKLEKLERSGNPRYPNIFVGEQAMYSDKNAQVIVTVLKDGCDPKCDSFRLKPLRILKDKLDKYSAEEPFDVRLWLGDLVAGPQAQAREMVLEVEHPTAGRIQLAGFPYKFSGTPAAMHRALHLLGEHNHEILVDLLGFSPGDLA